jgi:hypothetical protein
MEKERYTFRLSKDTISKLDQLQADGVIKNRTDGVIKAIDRFHIEEDNRENPFLRLLGSIIHNLRIVSTWEYIENSAKILLIHDESGEEDRVYKKGENSAIVERIAGDKMITVTIETESHTVIISSDEVMKMMD